jgi:tRNA modification GTPase
MPAPLPDTPPVGRFWFGRLGAELRDEVVLAVRPEGVEVQCHGGPEVIRLLIETYAAQGVQPCTWQQLQQLGPEPAWRQRILPLLVQAPTTRTAAILLYQYHGAFERALVQVGADLEHDGLDRAMASVAELTQLIALGRHLVAPWRVVVAGAPNVGKSSLVNALAGYTRCLVSPHAGTTRDVVATTIAIDGWPIELIDTAGLRAAAEDLEGQGIARAHSAIAGADLTLWVVDGSAPPVFPETAPRLTLINKDDLPAAWDWQRLPDALHISTKTKSGLDSLCAAISRTLVPVVPSAGDPVPVTAKDADLVVQLLDLLGAKKVAVARETLEQRH